jgi:hypothetical protein
VYLSEVFLGSTFLGEFKFLILGFMLTKPPIIEDPRLATNQSIKNPHATQNKKPDIIKLNLCNSR